jgi:hypothetical protein
LNIDRETKAFCASKTLFESININVAKLAIATYEQFKRIKIKSVVNYVTLR